MYLQEQRGEIKEGTYEKLSGEEEEEFDTIAQLRKQLTNLRK